MKKVLLLLVIAALFAAGIVSPAVSAAGTADGKDIQSGDYVLIGEKGLNFTAFTDVGYEWMVANNVGNTQFNIQSGTNIDIPANIATGLNYYQASLPDFSTAGKKYCIVENTDKFPFSLTTSDKALVNKSMTITLNGKPGATYKVYVEGGNTLGTPTITRDSSKEQKAEFHFTPTEAGTYTIVAECTHAYFDIPDEVLIKILDMSPESHLGLKYNPNPPTGSDFVPLRRKSDEEREL